MIPYALLNCEINQIEIRIIDVSVFHIMIRTPNEIDTIDSFTAHMYLHGAYISVPIHEFQITERIQNTYDFVTKIEIMDEEYKEKMNDFLMEYQQYIVYKQNNEQEKSIHYPLSFDSIYPFSYDSFLDELFHFRVTEEYLEKLKNIHLGICLESNIDYQSFIMDEFQVFKENYFKRIHLNNHLLKNINVEYVYIGNQFCSHLYPSISQLKSILNKAKEYQLKVVFQFTTMKQHEIQKIKDILDVLKEDSTIELVMNDFGMMELFKDYPFPLILGILLNKHVKDTRLNYIKNKEYIHQTSIHTDFYQRFLKEYNIQRISYESCGYKIDPIQPVDLYFPRYQMNTSGHCTMYAKCHNHNRAIQEEVYNCVQYCRNNYFLYPTHLNMIGKMNSLFGYDINALKDEEYLELEGRMIVCV